jgi:glycosyltransferase involved in cell wall biosynthesis
MAGIIFLMHSESNTGYAIEKLEKIFYRASIDAGIKGSEIFFAYPSLKKGKPRWMDLNNNNFTCFNYRNFNFSEGEEFSEYLKINHISSVFAFDLQPSNPVNPLLRRAGIQRCLSYWGAPMGSLNKPLVLIIKKLEVMLRRSGPDFYVFESEAMRKFAVGGRGIPIQKTIVIPTGVDVQKFKPGSAEMNFASDAYNIPKDRKIFCYSGHMEERKGVHVIVQAMADLILNKQRKDIHFLALGNKPGEELRFHEMAPANVFEYITFGGYRDDIEKIFSSSYAGIIASSGWDSWPMSVIEMGASGLPLLVSRLQGLREFVVDEANGYGFEPGNSTQLAEKIELLVDNPSLADAMSKNNRGKVVEFYSDAAQQAKLADIISDQLL